MRQHEASRTLVKSPPELWAECSDASSLARHLDQFGEIRITKLEPDTAVAWEGERGSGTVRIEPSGWGTKVILTATSLMEEVLVEAPVDDSAPPVAADSAPPGDAQPASPGAAEPEATADTGPPAEPEPGAAAMVEPPVARHRFRRLWARLRRGQSVGAQAADAPELEPVPGREPLAFDAPTVVPPTEAALTAALDSLGQAHHRPFSRG